MRISVVIPCHNGGRFIRQTLLSVQSQSFPAHEIIVVNDASTDDSVEQIERSGVRVHLVHEQFRNLCEARNAGIERATGDWVAYLDADDLWYPEHLKNAAALLQGTDDVAYLGHFDLLMQAGDETHPGRFSWPLTQPSSGLSCNTFADWFFTCEPYGLPSGYVHRLGNVRRHNGFDPHLRRAEDVDMFFRVIHGHTWACNPTATWAYRKGNPQSLSSSTGNMLMQYSLLQSVLKNASMYSSDMTRRFIRRQARQVLSLAFMEGDAEDRRRAWKLAAPHVPVFQMLFWKGMSLWDWPFRSAIHLKRHLHQHFSPIAATTRIMAGSDSA